jgi:hypothetical protein
MIGNRDCVSICGSFLTGARDGIPRHRSSAWKLKLI